jgi:hypothetical protein
MSSVESFLPTRFGVSARIFQGSGLPQGARQAVDDEVGPRKTDGRNRMTSYLAFRSLILKTVCVLM